MQGRVLHKGGFYKVVSVFSLFNNYLSLVNCEALHLTETEFFLCQGWTIFFAKYINDIISVRKVQRFIWATLYYLHSRMLYAKFGWNCPSHGRKMSTQPNAWKGILLCPTAIFSCFSFNLTFLKSKQQQKKWFDFFYYGFSFPSQIFKIGDIQVCR